MAKPLKNTPTSIDQSTQLDEPPATGAFKAHSNGATPQLIYEASPEELAAWRADVAKHGWTSMEALKAKYGIE